MTSTEHLTTDEQLTPEENKRWNELETQAQPDDRPMTSTPDNDTRQQIEAYAVIVVEKMTKLDSEVEENKKKLALEFAQFLEGKIRTDERSRFDVENMEAAERNAIYVPELAMEYGAGWSALKKSWAQLKYCLKTGDFEQVEVLKARIYLIREAMGLENEELY
jgi:hypothetical protein